MENKMKPFDREAAKAGALFYRYGDPTVPLRYIGQRRDGSIVFEDDPSSPVGRFGNEPAGVLRMCPRKVVRWVNIYRDPNQNLSLGDPYSTADRATLARAGSGRAFVGVACVEWEE